MPTMLLPKPRATQRVAVFARCSAPASPDLAELRAASDLVLRIGARDLSAVEIGRALIASPKPPAGLTCSMGSRRSARALSADETRAWWRATRTRALRIRTEQTRRAPNAAQAREIATRALARLDARRT